MNEQDQYEKICKPELEKIHESLDKFYVAIFEGNGEPGLKTQLKMLTKTVQGILWLGSIIVSAIIVCVVDLWIKKP